MKKTLFILTMALATACNSSQEKKDNKKLFKANKEAIAKIHTKTIDTALVSFSDDVLACLKVKNFIELAKYTKIDEEVLFYPYSAIDTTIAKYFAPNLIAMIDRSEKKVYWADYDGSGKPMDLSINDYFEKYINDKDYQKADSIKTNQKIHLGNNGDNVAEVLRNTEFVEYFCKGTGKMANKNWSVLRLVFRKFGNKYHLVGVIHRQWTI